MIAYLLLRRRDATYNSPLCIIKIQKTVLNVKLIILIIFSLVSCTSDNQIRKTKFKNFELNGVVKSFCIYSFEDQCPKDEIKQIDFIRLLDSKNTLFAKLKQLKIEQLNYYALNEDGKITLEIDFYSGTDQNTMVEYRYDIKGNKIRKAISSFDQVEFYIENNYFDELNNLIRVEEFNYRDLSFKRQYMYDDQNLRIEEKHYNKTDSLFLQRYYEYNDQGQLLTEFDKNDIIKSQYKYENENLVEFIQFNNVGEVTTSRNWQFDSLGNCVKESIFDTWTEENYSKTYEYDSLKNTIKVNVFDSNEILTGTSSFNYGKQSNLLSKKTLRFDSDSNLKEQTESFYNQYENLTKRNKKFKYQNEWKVSESEFYYEYDNNKNEILRMNSRKVPMEFREIEYY